MNEVSDSNKYILGKLPYVDPQHFKKKRANKKSDVYSVGVLLWEISSGKKPIGSCGSHSAATLMYEILDGKREIPVFGTPIDYVNIYTSMYIAIHQRILSFFFIIMMEL